MYEELVCKALYSRHMSSSGGVSRGCQSCMTSCSCARLLDVALWRRDIRCWNLEASLSPAVSERLTGDLRRDEEDEEEEEEEVLLVIGPAARTSVAIELFSVLSTSRCRTGVDASESSLTTFICK